MIILKILLSLGYNFSKVEAKFNEIDANNVDSNFEIDKNDYISSITYRWQKIKQKVKGCNCKWKINFGNLFQ